MTQFPHNTGQSPESSTDDLLPVPYELLMCLQKKAVKTIKEHWSLGSDGLVVELVVVMEQEYQKWQAGEEE